MIITEQAFWTPIAAGCAVMMKRLWRVMGNVSIASAMEPGIKSDNPKTGHKKATIITGVAHDPATIVAPTP